MQPELELGHDPEVAAAAAEGPQELRIARRPGLDDVARRGDDVGPHQVVAGEPGRAHQVADAAGQRQPADAGVPERARRSWRGRAASSPVDVLPQRAALDDRSPRRGGSTVTPRIRRRSMTMAPSAIACPATLWPPPRTAIGRPATAAARTAATTSSRVLDSDDHRRPAFDRRVEGLSRVIVVGVIGHRRPVRGSTAAARR